MKRLVVTIVAVVVGFVIITFALIYFVAFILFISFVGFLCNTAIACAAHNSRVEIFSVVLSAPVWMF